MSLLLVSNVELLGFRQFSKVSEEVKQMNLRRSGSSRVFTIKHQTLKDNKIIIKPS